MESTKEKVSYCIGYETGKNLKMQFSDINMDLLLDGFQNAIQEEAPKLAEKEIISILTTLRQQIEVQQKQYIAQISDKNKQEGEAFLKGNKEKDSITCLSSGLQYKIIKSGSGKTVPTLFDTVKIHYKGQFIDGKIFDSSYERNQPQVLPVNRVIQGWSEALQMMKTGDSWQLFVPHYLAYGEHGFGSHIGHNSTLIFEVELLEVNPQQ